MYNSRRKPLDEAEAVMTAIWSCTNETCKGWMRSNFSFSDQPVCPQCGSGMQKGEKKLQVVENTSPKHSEAAGE